MARKDGLKSIFGRLLGLEITTGHLIQNGKIMALSPDSPMDRTVLTDDFTGDALGAEWGAAVGTDPQVVTPTITPAENGVVRLVTGDDVGGTMALNGVQLQRALTWQADNGDLIFEANVKMSAITDVSLFVGFTDQVAALEAPIISAGSGDTLTTNATDAVGFMFDTAMSTDVWWATGVANDTDATAANNNTAPVADTYNKLRIEIDADGNATFYLDGTQYATVSSAVTKTVSLTPVVAAFSRGAATRNIDVDYIYAAQDR